MRDAVPRLAEQRDEYKVLVTPVSNFLLGCQALGHSGTTGLDIVHRSANRRR
jgi:hypothetical protein